MPQLDYPHIVHSDVARLERLPRIRVSQIVADHIGNCWSAEEIIRQYPHLTPAEVLAALGYYFDHREEIDVELSLEMDVLDDLPRSQTAVWERTCPRNYVAPWRVPFTASHRT